jgi:S1-C subfamily serine protease
MTVERRRNWRAGGPVVLALLVLVVVLLMGCGFGTGTTTTAGTPTTAAAKAAAAVVAANSTVSTQAAAVATAATTLAPSDGLLASPAEAVAEAEGPSVVNVSVTGTIQGRFGYQQEYSAEGSGVIISADGMIVTNNHVVSENDIPVTKITVTLTTGEKIPATIVGRDSQTDLAVIKIDKTGLVPATFVQDMSTVKVGQYAVAIGSPLGYSSSVTLGIISGLQRDLASLVNAADAQAYIDLIQTDAAISPGNSGGALLNAAGEVIGINVAYVPPQQTGAQNIGFAIPADVVQDVAQQLISTGTAQHPYLGVSLMTVTADLQTRFSLSLASGVLVQDVGSGSPAATAGLQQGDIITKVDGETVETDVDIFRIMRTHKPGDTITLTADRNGTATTVNVTLGQMPTQ